MGTARRPARFGWLKSFSGYRKNYVLTLMFIPVIAYYLIFKYAPMYGIVLAFKDYSIRKGILGSPWVGFTVFEELFATHTFVRAFRNTVIISLLRWVFGFPMPIILALMLNELKNLRFKKTMQTISYLPHFLSWIILTGLFTQLLSPTNGPINYIISLLGGKPIYFLADNAWFRSTMVITGIWKEIGWGSIVYLATIAGIDTELYEAAECDGATRWQKMFRITLPLMKPTIVILLIMNCGSILDFQLLQFRGIRDGRHHRYLCLSPGHWRYGVQHQHRCGSIQKCDRFYPRNGHQFYRQAPGRRRHMVRKGKAYENWVLLFAEKYNV